MRVIVPMPVGSVPVSGVGSVAVVIMRMMRVHAREHRAAIVHYKGSGDRSRLIPRLIPKSGCV